MVKLVGVTHNYTLTDFFGNAAEIDLAPTGALIDVIRTLPNNSRVGVEWQPAADLRDLDRRVEDSQALSQW